MRLLLAFVAVLGTGFAPGARAEAVRTKHVTAELVPENRSFEAGAENLLGLRLEMAPEWHTYWRFPGDSGLPTEVVWSLPAGWTAGELRWPVPKRIFVPPIVNYGFDGEALLAAPLQVPAGAGGEYTITADVSWLVCKEECIPEKAKLSLKVSVAKGKPAPGPLAHAFRRLREQQPRGVPAEVQAREKEFGISLQGPKGKIDFFPLAPMLLKGDAPPRVERSGDRVTLWLAKADPVDATAKALPGMVVAENGNFEVKASLAASAPPALNVEPQDREAGNPLLLAVFALLGGLILNLMPCVFPVLGIKVMSLVRQGGEGRAHARQHGHAYLLGVVACFWMLAGALVGLRAAGQAVGWGFQLQQPLFVVSLILLFSFVAADLAGYVHWSGRWMGAGSALAGREGLAGSFFTGALAVVVATPCTAPFMGTAIGAAIGEPGWVIFLVFTALGLGLALPFVALCYAPALLAYLPRPGAWMEKLKQLFAFPVAATVLWLFWVLAQQVGADGVLAVQLGLLLAAFALWLYRRGRRAFAFSALCAGLALCAWGAGRAAPAGQVAAEGAWRPYSEAALEEALTGGKPVFVDFTAAWCLTCQVNKKLVLDRPGTQAWLREKGVVLLLADWTNRDPAITRALERQGRIGVPLYLAYPRGEKTATVLPQLLSEDRLRSVFP